MVGVPGKSKGCSTCRRRKKGCDQKRPICGQCVQSGNVCGGYERELTFIIHPASKLAEKSYYVPPNAQQSTSFQLPSTLDRSALEAQCRALFWDLYLPHGTAEAEAELLEKCNHPPNWTSVLSELTHDETSLELAFSALSIARVGRSNNDVRLVKESTKLYGKALKDLQEALHDPVRMHTEEVLAACSLLGLYEIFEGGASPGRSVGWVSHAQGAAHLIESRGPERHINRQAHEVFLGARLPIIYAAMLTRQGTFLASDEWITIPWRGGCKTKADKVVDIISKIPIILERLDAVQVSAALLETKDQLLKLRSDCEELCVALDAWERSKSQRARPVAIEHERQEDDPYPFEFSFSWENHLFMNNTLVYWTGHLALINSINQIEFLLESIGFQSNICIDSTPTLQPARYYATCIAQSIPYSLIPDMGALGINYITFPMCVAFKHFLETNDDVVCSWLLHTCKSMRQQNVQTGSRSEGLNAEPLLSEDHFSLVSRRSSTDIDASCSRSITPSSTSIGGRTISNPELTNNANVSAVSRSCFKSTFIYENPARYYVYKREPG